MNLLSFLNVILAQGFQLPPGQPWTLARIMNEVLTPVANFLIAAGVIGAIITIVISGIMYFRAGSSDVEIKSAKTWFRNGVTGAFIILAVGVIINTIALVVTGGFFGGGGIGGPGPGPGSGGQGGPGSPCINNSQCVSGTSCDIVSGICDRNNGNLEGEICKGDNDCSYWLRCKSSNIFGTGQKTCQQP